MHIPMVSPKIPKGKWIKWAPPPFGILKLNTDGSLRNGMAAGGGIIRDYKGSALVAFSTFYGPGTNTFAEARAPLFWSDALLQIRLLQSSSGECEKIIFDSICGGAVPYMIRSLKNFLLPSMSISHIYREGNQSEDTLATHGHFHQEHFEFLSFLMALFLLPLLPKEVSCASLNIGLPRVVSGGNGIRTHDLAVG
ncbi:unnamed protein product [Lactuca virosa]|uniref:RNase H type-1 domain-containing protein n=1 Tax=Lactuca virosa TaxID=75947 RepID=A0AAU9LCI6_9ASTR|nr:unnamed protein product [Lactuca virosa]